MANAFANAVYNEDQKKKLMEIYKNQGAGAVTSAALGMMNQQGATQANTAGGSSNPGAVSSVAIPTGAAAASGASARSQRINEALTAANANASPLVKSLTSERTNAIMDANARKTTPYMAAIAAADTTAAAPTSTQGGRMEDGSFRLGDGSTYDSLQGAIDANAAKTRAKNQYEITTGENGETLYGGKPLTKGTGFLAQKGDAGNITSSHFFGTHVTDAAGNYHQYERPDVIDTYIWDPSGGYQDYHRENAKDDPLDRQYLHGWVKGSDGYIYDLEKATPDELWGFGYVRDAHGVRLANDNDYIAYAAMNGASPQQIGEMYRRLQEGYSGGNSVPQNTQPYTTPQNTPQGGNAVPRNTAPMPQNTTPQGGGYSGGGTVPRGSSNGSGNTGSYPSGGSGTGYTPYQLALDQFDYGKAPEWTGTEYERQRDDALQNARNMRWDGSDYQNQRDELLQNAMNPYEGSPYDQQRDDALAAYGEAWQGSEYQPKRDEALQRAENMQWNYDPNADPVWQALQKQYRREGDRATKNALGQAASMTGGVPSSYAVTAASQAGDYYAAQLSDRLPQVYQDAYNRYLQEFQRQMGISDQYQGFDDREYSRWADQQGKNLDLADRYNQYGQQDYNQYMDRVSQQLQGADRYNGYDQTEYQRYLDQYGQELDAADRLNNYGATEYDRYRDRLGQFNTDRSFTYGLNRDAVSDARYADETAYERAWNEENRDYSRNYQARRDAILDNRADREWAQELKEYADSQNWKATEWQQYLREYEDQLSDKEREWVYQMSRDAENDRRYNQEYEYQRTRDAEADRRYNDQTAYERAVYDEDRAYQRQQDELDRKYQQDVFNYNAEQDALDRQYQQDVFNYNAGQDALDNQYRENQYQQTLQDYDTNQYYDMLNAFKSIGFADQRIAEYFGIPAGTSWEDYGRQYGYEAPQSGGYSGGYTGGDYTDGGDESQTEAPAKRDESGKRTGTWQDNDGYTYNGYHPDGQWKSVKYDSTAQEARKALDGKSKTEAIKWCLNKVEEYAITQYEAYMILEMLGFKESSAGTGRNYVGNTNVQMVQ